MEGYRVPLRLVVPAGAESRVPGDLPFPYELVTAQLDEVTQGEALAEDRYRPPISVGAIDDFLTMSEDDLGSEPGRRFVVEARPRDVERLGELAPLLQSGQLASRGISVEVRFIADPDE